METFQMGRRECARLEVLGRVQRKELRLTKAAELLGVTARQLRRLYQRYRQQGVNGLVHRARGRRSNRAKPAALREAVLRRYAERYGDFGPTLAAEHLAREGYALDHETLRRWLLAAGLWQRRRQRAQHRRWRARKQHLGEMVQMDGSEHDWFEGRRGRCVLLVLIDDATNRTYARFYESETTWSAFEVFGRYVRRSGVPRSLYVDRDSIYRTPRATTAEEELAQTGPLTQFGRSMHRLGVRLICAHSPQAKGRVERRHGVFQDRLVKELRLAGLGELERANAYLEEEFLPELNRRFTVPAACVGDLHRKLRAGERIEEVLSFEEARVVQRDGTVSWRGRRFQLEGAGAARRGVGRKITLRQYLDGTLSLLAGGRKLAWRELLGGASAGRASAPGVAACAGAARARRPWKPPAEHPWRQGGRRRRALGVAEVAGVAASVVARVGAAQAGA